MNAAVLHTLGKPPRFETFPEPRPNGEEVLVQVTASSLKPVDKQMAAGSHYGSPRELPVICGLDGVGRLQNGARVFFAAARRPYGAMVERAVVHRARCWPVPDSLNDVAAAALVNPGMSAWLSLEWRAKLAAGETVLILGATGVTGRLAVQIAKFLGAGRVIAAGRNAQALETLQSLGADTLVPLGNAHEDLTQSLTYTIGAKGIDVILDYLWGRPTEALLAAVTRSDFNAARSTRMRLVQVGESAGPTIQLPAAALRSSTLEILGAGSGAMPPMEVIRRTYDHLLARAAKGELRVETEQVPLREIENAWDRAVPSGRRLVVVP
jgi:NADPH:quinone reductase-like Zn-dependent oxidoreductase